MRVLRALGGSLLWLLAGVVGLLGVVLSVTVILAPVGIPLLLLARKLFKYSLTLFLPRAVRHPVQELGRKGRRDAADAVGSSKKALKDARKHGRSLSGKAKKQVRRRTGRRRLSLGG